MSGLPELRHDVYLRRRHTVTTRQQLLGGLVGEPVVYMGPERRPLYPERIGCSCRVVLVSETDHICPLIVEFPDGFRGIAEPSDLMEQVN